jgi:phosphoribosylanthranilate isomerase
MTIKIKICGTTSLEDARLAADAGADMLGFIFYESSPRNITPEQATEVISTLRAEKGENAPLMVGVFVDEFVERVQAIREQAGLDALQLHGSEPPVEMRLLNPHAFKAIRPQNRGDAEGAVATYSRVLPDNPEIPQFLLDAFHPWKMGGTGQMADWSAALVVARRFRLMLAGGLTVENVAEAIHTVNPWGVDVVSGVEATKGVKDPAKLKQFIETVRANES